MTNYCSQDDVEKYLNIDFTNNPDPSIALWIAAASEKIDKFCSRDFDNHTGEIEYQDGKGKWGDLDRHMHTAVQLKNYPVLAVTEVVDDTTTLTEGTDYEVYPEEAMIRLHPSRYFKKKLKGIKLTYDYGYAAIPEVIKDVCRWLVVESLKKSLGFQEFGVARSISLEGESVSVPEIIDFPPELQERLRPFVKVGY